MQMQNKTVVTMRYVMKNASGEILEENMDAAPVQYIHGGGAILPQLESSLHGLKAGDKKSIRLIAGSGSTDEYFIFDIIIDDVRAASEDEILQGHIAQANDASCGPGCNC